MNVWWAVAILAGLAVAYLLRDALSRTLQDAFGVIIGLLNDVVGGLQTVRNSVIAFWREHFGEAFSVRRILGGLIMLGMFGVLTWADFILLRVTLASLLPTGENDWTTSIGGYRLAAAELSAVAVVALEFLPGMLAFDLFDLTDFFHFGKKLSSKARRALGGFCLIILTLVCALQAGLAVWRTLKIGEMAEAGGLGGGDVLSAGLEGNVSQTGELTPAGLTEGPPGWVGTIDRLPLPAMALVNFLIPLGAAFSAIGLYPVVVGGVGVLAALGVLLPLGLTLAMVVLLRNGMAYLSQFTQTAFRVLTAPGELVEQGFRRGRAQRAPEAERAQAVESPVNSAGAQSEASRSAPHAAGATGTASPSASHGNGHTPPTDGNLEEVIEAMNTNPLGMSEEDLLAFSRTPGNGKGEGR